MPVGNVNEIESGVTVKDGGELPSLDTVLSFPCWLPSGSIIVNSSIETREGRFRMVRFPFCLAPLKEALMEPGEMDHVMYLLSVV